MVIDSAHIQLKHVLTVALWVFVASLMKKMKLIDY